MKGLHDKVIAALGSRPKKDGVIVMGGGRILAERDPAPDGCAMLVILDDDDNDPPVTEVLESRLAREANGLLSATAAGAVRTEALLDGEGGDDAETAADATARLAEAFGDVVGVIQLSALTLED